MFNKCYIKVIIYIKQYSTKNHYFLFLHLHINITLHLDYDKGGYATMPGYATKGGLGLARHWVLTGFTMIPFHPAP